MAAAATHQEKILEERERGKGWLVVGSPTGEVEFLRAVGATPTWRRASLRSRVGGCELPVPASVSAGMQDPVTCFYPVDGEYTIAIEVLQYFPIPTQVNIGG
jgi:hypothetical protein